MKCIVLLLLEAVMFKTIFAVGLADYVPSFLVAGQNNGKSSLNYLSNNQEPIVISDNGSNDFCKNSGIDSVFCTQRYENSVSKSNNHVASPLILVKSIINTNPNQTSFQSQNLRDALNRYNSNYMLNITPKDNISVGIGATYGGFINQLQFKIKY